MLPRFIQNLNLGAKITIVLVLVSVLTVAAGTLVTYGVLRGRLVNTVGQQLSSLANAESREVGHLLVTQLELLEALGLDQAISNQLVFVNSSYGRVVDNVEQRLLARNEEWLEASASDPIVRNVVQNYSTENLRAFQARFPDHLEVFVTDRYGGLVAATSPPSDYYQADEEWWQEAYNNGAGDLYLGEPTFDESVGAVALAIAVPIRSQTADEVVGVLRSTYRLDALREALTTDEVREHIDLIFPSGIGLESNTDDLETYSEADLAAVAAIGSSHFDIFDYEGDSNVVAAVPVGTNDDNPVVSNLNWTLVVAQPEAEALAIVNQVGITTLAVSNVILLLTILIGVILANVISQPIKQLTETAARVAEGDLSRRVKVESQDEIGQLGAAFNEMAAQQQATINRLEERVTERTQQLATVVNISQSLTRVLDLSDLLRQVVEVTKESFNFYHVHIYLLEDQSETLLLAEGYGEAGAEMKRQGHSIPLITPKSLVAQAAREGQVVTVPDVSADPAWLPNPLLPDTRAEMAVPIMLDTEVVGVLDVQSAEINGLTADDEAALQALANQVAGAVRNARIFSQTQDALYEAQKLQQFYTEQAWQAFSRSRPSTNYEVRQQALPPLAEADTPEADTAIIRKQTIDWRGRSTNGDSNGHTAVATPLTLRGQVVGALGLHADPDREWTEDEIALIEAVSEQMSLAMENARLLEQTSRRAGRERVIADMTQQIWASGELEQVMQTIVKQVGTQLDADKVVLRLLTDDATEEDA